MSLDWIQKPSSEHDYFREFYIMPTWISLQNLREMKDDLFKIIRLDELRIPKCKMDSLVGWFADDGDGDDQRHFRTYIYHADHGKDKLLLSFLFSSRKGSKKVKLKFLHSVSAKTKTFIQNIITLSYSDKQKCSQMDSLVVFEGTIIIILQ